MIGALAILAAQLGFAALLLASAATKLASPRQFAATVDSYMLLPVPLVAPVAVALSGLELVLGLAMLPVVPVSPHLALAATGVVLLVYGLAMAINVARGRTGLGCGCSGFGKAEAPISRAMVGRNVLLAAIALMLAGGQATLPGPLWAACLAAAPAAIVSLLLYAAFSQHQTNRALLGAPAR